MRIYQIYLGCRKSYNSERKDKINSINDDLKLIFLTTTMISYIFEIEEEAL